MPEVDPGPSEAYSRLCEELDRHRPLIREEIKRRAEKQGKFLELGDMQDPDKVYGYVFLCGTPCFGRG